MHKRQKADSNGIIPNFCGFTEMLLLMTAMQLLALVLALMVDPYWPQFWTTLGLLSLQIQWIALLGAVTLCRCRVWLNRQSDIHATLLSYAILMLVVGVVSEFAFQVNQSMDNTALAHGAFLLRNLGIGAVIVAMYLRYLYVSDQWRRNVEAQSLARVNLLQARIRPHFLFNCMNTIASLTRSDPEAAERVVEDLSDLFRYSLSEDNKRIPLSQELTLVQRFLAIESIRLGDRIQVALRVDAPLDALIPPLTLQPLVENAVYHGVEPRAEGGCIQIDISLRQAKITVDIVNPRPAVEHKRLGNHMALANIAERLQLWYGRAANFVVERGHGSFGVHIELPYEPESKNDLDC